MESTGVLSTVLFMLAVVLASAVEMVEAVTIVLAAGMTRGWRSAIEGASVALLLLALLVVAFGSTLGNLDVAVLRTVIGGLLLVFGLQWLQKAILRASGHKDKHDEQAIFNREVQELSKSNPMAKGKRDSIAFAISLKGVFLEGVEVIVIVISFGASSGRLGLAALGASVTALVVGAIGFSLAKPLAKVPENAMKLGVANMLVTFGTFWGGEGLGIEWPLQDAFILVLLGLFALVTFVSIPILRKSRIALERVPQQ